MDSCTPVDSADKDAASATTGHRSGKGRGVPNIPARFIFRFHLHRRSVGAFVADGRVRKNVTSNTFRKRPSFYLFHTKGERGRSLVLLDAVMLSPAY